MKVSIASFSFNGMHNAGTMDVFGYLETVRYRYNLDAADLWSGTLDSTDEDYVRKIREAMDEKELVLANLCVDGAHPWDDEEKWRDEHHRLALDWMKTAEILGAKTLRIDMGGEGETFTQEQMDHIVKRFREYAQRAYDNGYRVGPETHWGPELSVSVQDDVRKAVDHPGYGVLLHIGHWHGDKAEADRGDALMAPWAMHTHVDQPTTERRAEAKMRMMRDAGYEGYWGVEHHSGKNEHEEVARQLATVKRAEARLMRGDA